MHESEWVTALNDVLHVFYGRGNLWYYGFGLWIVVTYVLWGALFRDEARSIAGIGFFSLFSYLPLREMYPIDGRFTGFQFVGCVWISLVSLFLLALPTIPVLYGIFFALPRRRREERTRWEAEFAYGLRALKQFAEREGHGRVPIGHFENYNDEEFKLHVWCRGRIWERTMRRLSKGHEAVLNDLDFDWEPEETRFELCFGALKQFAEREGHTYPNYRHRETYQGQEVDLGKWCSHLRAFRFPTNSGPPESEEQIARLDALGFKWDHERHPGGRSAWPQTP
jgi:hypothetical protein